MIPKKFTIEERRAIEQLSSMYSGAQIANIIGRSRTGVNAELRKCPRGEYNADKAQSIADNLQLHRYDKLRERVTGDLTRVESLLDQGFSINEISQKLSTAKSTIRKHIERNNLIEKKKDTLEDRITALEMIVDILIEQLNELIRSK